MASNGNYIDDYGGKDKYTFENVTGATDKKFGISEYGGKDKYTLKSGTSYVNITDNYKITVMYPISKLRITAEKINSPLKIQMILI